MKTYISVLRNNLSLLSSKNLSSILHVLYMPYAKKCLTSSYTELVFAIYFTWYSDANVFVMSLLIFYLGNFPFRCCINKSKWWCGLEWLTVKTDSYSSLIALWIMKFSVTLLVLHISNSFETSPVNVLPRLLDNVHNILDSMEDLRLDFFCNTSSLVLVLLMPNTE